jgi:hypothetical protein
MGVRSATENTEGNDMKMGIAVCAIVSLLFISIVFPSPFQGASAQSGRVVPKPTPIPSAESQNQSEAKQKFVADPDADKYKLVFPINYRKKLYKDPRKNRKEKNQWEKEQDAEDRRTSRRNSLIEQLNKAGDQGYRLIALVYPLIGVVKLSNVQYEYAWFETSSGLPSITNGFDEKYAELARRGFSVVAHVFFVGGGCVSEPFSPISNDEPYSYHGPQLCGYSDLFLLERERGVEKPLQSAVARHPPSWLGLGNEAALTTQISDYMALGFTPILAISRCEVFLRPITDKGEFLPVGSEVKVVTGNVKKKVNELARQGYRLALTYFLIAVMYRHPDNTTPVSYIWLESRKKKSFDKELARLQDSGAIYRMIYPDFYGIEHTLIFEQPAVDVSKRREYKVLKIEFQETENFADQRVDIDLAPSSKETIKTLNSLVKEGFAVRGLFVSDFLETNENASVLLERTQ